MKALLLAVLMTAAAGWQTNIINAHESLSVVLALFPGVMIVTPRDKALLQPVAILPIHELPLCTQQVAGVVADPPSPICFWLNDNRDT
jgi:hypothetical protein